MNQSPVTIEQILNPPQEVVVPTGKGKAAAKGQAAAETVSFEPSDLELTSKAENNYLLGDALQQIIHINFEERARLKHPQTASYLPLKICLAGYPFAGKKTQAAFIAKKFGLQVFQMDELVKEAIEFSDAYPNEIYEDPEHDIQHFKLDQQVSSDDE